MPLALVTGAARANSIAASIVPRLVSDGWDVVTSDIDTGDYPCDLSDASAPTALIERITRERGPLSALVLSHAHDIESGILDTTAESFDEHVAVNARATLLLIAAFARHVDADGGAIVAFTSDHTTGNLPYGASKGALDRIVISAARESGRGRYRPTSSTPDPWTQDGWTTTPGQRCWRTSRSAEQEHRRTSRGSRPSSYRRKDAGSAAAPPRRRRLLRTILTNTQVRFSSPPRLRPHEDWK